MNKICEMLNIKYPIFQGAMANISEANLVSSVSNAGGLGVLGTGGWNADVVREQIRKTKELTNKTFAVNVMMVNPDLENILDVLIEEEIKVIITGAGNPGAYVEKLKAGGILVIPVVPTASLAKRLERSGVAAVIAEGTEAGGHVGEITTMALLPQVVDAVSIPVIGAGGIGDSRGMVAAFALGASAVQIGTAFLVAEECIVHDNYKAKVIKAKDSDTIVTGRSTGAPVRSLKNKMTKKYKQLEDKEMSMLEREALTIGSLRKAVLEGDVDNGSVMAGQISGMLKEIKPAKDIIDDLFKDIDSVLEGISKCLK